MERDGVGVALFIFGVLLLGYSIFITITGSSCEGSYPTNPSSPLSSAYYKASDESCSYKKLTTDGVYEACSQYEKCKRDTFSWEHFPYIRIFIAIIVIYSTFGEMFNASSTTSSSITSSSHDSRSSGNKTRRRYSDEINDEIVERYLEQNPSPDTTMDIVIQLSEEYGRSVASIRSLLSRRNVYIRKS